MPPQPKVGGAAPPWIAAAGYGFGLQRRLEGNVAHLVIHGFPPLFESVRQAIAERLSEIADADAAILDLRGNGGGFPPTVALMASYFCGAEPVHLNTIHRRDTDHTEENWTERELRGKRFGPDKPVYVLMRGPYRFVELDAEHWLMQEAGDVCSRESWLTCERTPSRASLSG